MADIESLERVTLGPADIGAALALSNAVGWNQTAEDWALFIACGTAFGLREPRGRLIASAAALPYGDAFGWISMVIVAPDWRRHGLARRLMGDCIALLRGAGRAALLDATPAGAEVYARLGFVELGGMERWEGEGGGAQSAASVERLEAAAIARLIAADRAGFGADRGFLLRDFLARPGAMALACDGAMLVLRRGERALQLGPLLAPSATAARRLLSGALALAQGPLFLDLLEPWSDLAPLLEAEGFRRQRPFRRMALGCGALPGASATLVCAAGPEFG